MSEHCVCVWGKRLCEKPDQLMYLILFAFVLLHISLLLSLLYNTHTHTHTHTTTSQCILSLNPLKPKILVCCVYVKGNPRLNMAFVASLFLAYPELGPTREEIAEQKAGPCYCY